MRLKENTAGKEEKLFITDFEYCKNDEEMIFNFDCQNSSCTSAYEGYNKPIYEENVCEVFLCKDKNLKEYYEIEVAPNGSVFFAKIIWNNPDFFDTEYLENTLNTSAKTHSNGYNINIRIKYKDINCSNKAKIKFNAFRIETVNGKQNLMALSPTLCGRFHKPEFFIELK
jgi:hypothetical protein